MVSMGLWRRTGLFGGIGRKARDEVEHAIAAVGLTGFEDRAIGTLSGGQMQRMLFARLLLQDARVIVLDEPFNAVDAKTSADLFDLVRRWHGEKRTVLTALHDIDFVKANFPETLLLAREPVAWGRTATVLTAENLLDRAAHVRGVRRAAPRCAPSRRAVSLTLSPCGRGWRGQAKRRPSRVRGSLEQRPLTRSLAYARDHPLPQGARVAPSPLNECTTSSSPRSPSSSSCAARSPAPSRWRSAPARSACS